MPSSTNNSTKDRIDLLLKAKEILELLRFDDEHEIPNRLKKVLADMGNCTQADRSYIFEYNHERGTNSNTYEWCRAGISSQINELQDLPISAFPEWITTHENGESLIIENVNELADSPLKETLAAQDILSLIAIPYFQGKACAGFIGLDWVNEPMGIGYDHQLLLSIVTQNIGAVIRDLKSATKVFEKQSEKVQKNSLKSRLFEESKQTIFWDLNLKEKTYSFNEAFERQFGHKSGTFRGSYQNLLDIIHPEDHLSFNKAIESLQNGKNLKWSGSFRIYAHDKYIRVLVNMMSYRNIKGELSNILGSLNPASDFLDNQDLFEQAAKIAKIGAAEIDLNQERINYTDSFAELAGYSEKELLQYQDIAEVQVQIRGQWVSIHEALTNFSVRKGEALEGNFLYKLPLKQKEHWFKTKLQSFSDNKSGHQKKYLIIIQDVDENIKQNIILKQTTRLLEEAQKVGQLGYYVIDFANSQWEVSPILEEMLQLKGIQDRSLESWLNFVHPKHHKETKVLFEKSLHEKSPYSTRYLAIQQESKNEIWVEVSGQIEFDQAGNPVQRLGTVRNINDTMKYIQSIEDQNRRFREIAWAQSHLLRAPLTRMQSLVNTLYQNEVIKDKDFNITGEIEKSLSEMDLVVQDVVEKAQILEESGLFKIDRFQKSITNFNQLEFLLVDDDPVVNIIHQRILGVNTKFPVRAFNSGNEFLHWLENDAREDTGYVILLDINMPGKNGWDVLEELQRSPFEKQCIVVMLSSSTDRKDMEKSYRYRPVLDYIQKPLNQHRLARLLNLAQIQAVINKS